MVCLRGADTPLTHSAWGPCYVCCRQVVRVLKLGEGCRKHKRPFVIVKEMTLVLHSKHLIDIKLKLIFIILTE